VARHPIQIRVAIDDNAHGNAVTWISMAGAHVITSHTTLLHHLLTIDLHSTFVGGRHIDTQACHLLLGPGRYAERAIQRRHPHSTTNTTDKPESCLLEHWSTLLELGADLGHRIRIDAPPAAMDALAAAAADA